MTETKPTNGLLTDRLNNTRTKNRPIWLTIDGSKPTNNWWQTLHESFSQYHHGYIDQSRSTDQTYNIIDWQTLFTWLWRWLSLRLSKRQSPTTVLFRTTLTGTITLYVLFFALFQCMCCERKPFWSSFPKWYTIERQFTAPFKNMRTLKFKAQPTNAFFATVNPMFGGSSQFPTSAEHFFVVWTVLNDLITSRSAVDGSWEGRQTFDWR